MADKNYRGKHARHASEEDLRRLDEEETRELSRKELRDNVVRGAHAAIDMEETRKLDDADKTAVLDFLYEGRVPATVEMTASHASPDSKTVAFDSAAAPGRPLRVASETMVLPQNVRDSAQDPVRGYQAGGSQAAPYACASVPPASGGSYVKDGPNAQVVGFAEAPAEEEAASGRKAKRAAKKAGKKSAAYAGPVEPLEPKPAGRRRKKKRGCLGRLLILLLILLALLIAAGAALAYPVVKYCNVLDQALELPADLKAAVEAELTPAKLGKPFYTLLLGSDSREGYSQDTSERSDVIMLIRTDPLADQVTIVTVPRDTPYRLEDGSLVKLNEAYNRGGAPQVIRAVSDLTGVPISHYAEIGFSDLGAIVDAVGGVTANVDRPLTISDIFSDDVITLDPGEQVLDGKQAQVLARARLEYIVDQDAHRQSNDRSLAMGIAKSILDRPKEEIPGTVVEVAGYVDTDVESYDILTTALPMLLKQGGTTIYSCTGPYAGEINAESGGLWLCYENPQGWANLMSVVDSGGDPSAVDLGY